jgi:homocysteine S-methyltransferase family protein
MPYPLLILDGGMGRELLRRGAPFAQPQWSALALMQQPAAVADVHRAYIEAGADIITTNSYALVPFHIGEDDFRLQGGKLATLAGQLARQAVSDSGKKVRVAASLPPLFGSYRPDLFDLTAAPGIARPLIDGQMPYADLWLAETQSSTTEVRALYALAPHESPFWASFTLDDEAPADPPRLRSGESITDAVATVMDIGADALLFNCSHPEIMTSAITAARTALDAAGSTMRLGVYANAFCAHEADEAALPANDGLDEIRHDLSPAAYLEFAKTWRAAGADIIGGCCGIGPEHIAVLAAWRDGETLSQ